MTTFRLSNSVEPPRATLVQPDCERAIQARCYLLSIERDTENSEQPIVGV